MMQRTSLNHKFKKISKTGWANLTIWKKNRKSRAWPTFYDLLTSGDLQDHPVNFYDV